MKPQTIFVSLLALAGLAAPVGATTVTYTTSSALESANSDLTFTNINFSAYFGQSGLTSVTAGGVTFTDSVGGPLEVCASGRREDQTQGGTIDVTLAPGVLAFGVDLQNATSSYGSTVGFTGDGVPFSYTTPSGASTFFGAADSSSLTGLTTAPQFSFSGNLAEISNFTIGTGSDPAPTPEAATLLLIGGGLIMMRFFKKRDESRQGRHSEPEPHAIASPVCANPQAVLS